MVERFGQVVEGEIRPAKGEIADCRYFTPVEVQELIEKDLLYKPEYNLSGVDDWLNQQSYPLDVVETMEVQVGSRDPRYFCYEDVNQLEPHTFWYPDKEELWDIDKSQYCFR